MSPLGEIANILSSIPAGAVIGGVVGKRIYEDLASPTVKEAGALGAKIFVALCASAYNWSENRKNRFESLQNDVLNNLKDVPKEKIINNAPEYIIAPAMSAYSYSINNEELRKMYANLISKALLEDESDKIHPSIVTIIQNLHPKECLILKYMNLDPLELRPIIQLNWEVKNPYGLFLSKTHIFQYPIIKENSLTSPGVSIIEKKEFVLGNPEFISNLSRLGLISVNYDISLVDKSLYAYLENLPLVLQDKKDCELNGYNFKVNHGTFRLTPLGQTFVSICV